MKHINFTLQVHQPYRLRDFNFFEIGGKHQDYFNEELNRDIIQRIAENSYGPANELLLKAIQKYGDAVKVNFAISGTAIDQLASYAPTVLDSFKKLSKTGNVEFLGQTYGHSLPALKSNMIFIYEVKAHSDRVFEVFKKRPTVFSTTGLPFLKSMEKDLKTLEFAGIDKNTPDVEGGTIERDADGNPTGVLKDNAMNLVYEIMPKPSKNLLKKALIEAQEKCFSYGLTSVHDADLKQDVLELMEEMQTNNELKMRIYAMVYATDSSLDYYLNRSKIKTKSLNIGAFKIYMDGALGSKGARMKEAYLNNEGKKGIYVTSKETLLKFGKRIKDSDFQLNVHAIGDAANEVVLKTFVEKLEIKKERRWRVEHAQIVDVKDLHYYKTILPSVQPTHATSDMYWVEKLIGSQRMKGAYAYKDLLDLHGVLPLGTDFPIEDVNPFKTFYAAVARKDANGFPKNGFQIKNALTRKQTIKGMTIWGAYAAFEEKQKGSIEVGKLADFIVLDQDIMTVDIDKIIDTKVLRTYLGGELVYA